MMAHLIFCVFDHLCIFLCLQVRDIQFDVEEQRFLDVERTCQGFLANVESFISQLQSSLSLQLVVAEDIADYYAERNKLTEVDRFRGVQHLVLSQFFSEFVSGEYKCVNIFHSSWHCYRK